MTILPMALRSRAEIRGTSPEPSTLSLAAAGTTFTMAQEANWIDSEYFAVGRWDGSLSIFKFTDAPTIGPMIAKAVNSPDQEGIQMITPVGPGVFISSNDEGSAICWTAAQSNWCDLQVGARLVFEDAHGVANSGATVDVGGKRYLAMGARERLAFDMASGELACLAQHQRS